MTWQSPITDVDFLLFYNAAPDPVDFTVPLRTQQSWDVVIDTAGRAADADAKGAGAILTLEGRSMLVLRAHREPEVEPDHSVAASLSVRTQQAGAATTPAPPVGVSPTSTVTNPSKG